MEEQYELGGEDGEGTAQFGIFNSPFMLARARERRPEAARDKNIAAHTEIQKTRSTASNKFLALPPAGGSLPVGLPHSASVAAASTTSVVVPRVGEEYLSSASDPGVLFYNDPSVRTRGSGRGARRGRREGEQVASSSSDTGDPSSEDETHMDGASHAAMPVASLEEQILRANAERTSRELDSALQPSNVDVGQEETLQHLPLPRHIPDTNLIGGLLFGKQGYYGLAKSSTAVEDRLQVYIALRVYYIRHVDCKEGTFELSFRQLRTIRRPPAMDDILPILRERAEAAQNAGKKRVSRDGSRSGSAVLARAGRDSRMSNGSVIKATSRSNNIVKSAARNREREEARERRFSSSAQSSGSRSMSRHDQVQAGGGTRDFNTGFSSDAAAPERIEVRLQTPISASRMTEQKTPENDEEGMVREADDFLRNGGDGHDRVNGNGNGKGKGGTSSATSSSTGPVAEAVEAVSKATHGGKRTGRLVIKREAQTPRRGPPVKAKYRRGKAEGEELYAPQADEPEVGDEPSAVDGQKVEYSPQRKGQRTLRSITSPSRLVLAKRSGGSVSPRPKAPKSASPTRGQRWDNSMRNIAGGRATATRYYLTEEDLAEFWEAVPLPQELVFSNGVDDEGRDVSEDRPFVHLETGDIHHFVYGKVVLEQHYDMRFFPFDTHDLCANLSNNFSGDQATMNIIVYAVDFDRRAMFDPEWNLCQPLILRKSPVETSIFFPVRRYPFYYTVNFVLFLFCLNLIGLAGFSIEAGAVADRLAISATVALAAIAYKVVCSDVLPRINYSTAMDYYILGSFFWIFVLNCYFASVPSFLYYHRDVETMEAYFDEALPCGLLGTTAVLIPGLWQCLQWYVESKVSKLHRPIPLAGSEPYILFLACEGVYFVKEAFALAGSSG
ncbi:unnamed protein product [Amoebophrya sp. A25]|nr:unnamed protein product [Amoebophrya sp. A25]|eukprot:GSA25T00002729001.1